MPPNIVFLKPQNWCPTTKALLPLSRHVDCWLASAASLSGGLDSSGI